MSPTKHFLSMVRVRVIGEGRLEGGKSFFLSRVVTQFVSNHLRHSAMFNF